MNKITILSAFTFIMLANYSYSQKTDSTSSPQADSINYSKLDTINIAMPDTIKPLKVVNSTPSKIAGTKNDFYLRGAVTITNKGISYIPNLSLGKPATLFDLSIGNEKLAFEPQVRFALNGEPWAFLFPVRYKIRSTGKFQVTAGVNPLLNFKNITYTIKGVSTTELVNRRYLGGELRPSYFFTKSISAGINYLYFCGVSDRAVNNTHFVSFSINLSNIKFGSKFFAKVGSQVYYLNQDGKDGFYFNSAVTLLKRNFPFSVQAIMNAIIRTDIPGSEEFMWNVSLIYSFNKKYIRAITPN